MVLLEKMELLDQFLKQRMLIILADKVNGFRQIDSCHLIGIEIKLERIIDELQVRVSVMHHNRSIKSNFLQISNYKQANNSIFTIRILKL